MHLEIRIATILLVLRALAAQQQTSVHGETADPAQSLRPRNFNPHPYAIELDGTQQNAVPEIGDNSLRVVANADASKNHVKRRQSPALYNQGPIQFPTNNDVTTSTANNNNNINQLQQTHNRRPLVVGGTQLFQSVGSGGGVGRLPQVSSTVRTAASLDTDYGDYDQQSLGTYNKKHYAFSYVVRDHESGDDFSHSQQQQRDGAVKGSYKVQLPDGRTQVVKYTADEGGYKADVSYIEDNHIAPTYSQPLTASSPHLIAAEPIYKYYKSLQDNQLHQQQQHSAANNQLYRHPSQTHHHQSRLNYESLSAGYAIPQPTPTTFAAPHNQHAHLHVSHPAHLIATPATVYHQQQPQPSSSGGTLLLASPTPSTLPYGHRLQPGQYVQNVQIDTYNTAPHHHQQQQQQQQQQLHYQQQQQHHLQPTRIVFPTSPTPYQDIHVLPSPRPYASTAPFVAAGSQAQRLHGAANKHTNIVSSPATLTGGPDASVGNYNYRDYDYQQQQVRSDDYRRPAAGGGGPSVVVFGPTEATPVLLQPNQALYYKQSR